MNLKLILIVSAVFFVSACSTTSTRPYTASTDNVIQIKATLAGSDAKITVLPIMIAEGVDTEHQCRLVGALDVGAGKTVPEYIAEALRSELFLAEAYDPAGVPISAVIEKMEFSSVGTGSWVLGLKVATPNNSGYQVEIEHKFKSSWIAGAACQNSVDAFAPAVSKLIKAVVSHPQFKNLVKG